MIGKAKVIDHQAAGLVAEDAVDAGDGLRETVTLHRLISIHRVEAGGVKAGEPHVAHDHNAERVFAVLEPVCQFAALVLVANMWLPIKRIGCRSRHHNLQHPFVVIFVMPAWS